MPSIDLYNSRMNAKVRGRKLYRNLRAVIETAIDVVSRGRQASRKNRRKQSQRVSPKINRIPVLPLLTCGSVLKYNTFFFVIIVDIDPHVLQLYST